MGKFLCMAIVTKYSGYVGCSAAYVNNGWFCRIINGCSESGNSDPTGMAALTFLFSMSISGPN